MSDSKLRQWLEIVGIGAVVASLVFVGVEIRQDHLAHEQGQERMARILAGALEVVLNELVTVVG